LFGANGLTGVVTVLPATVIANAFVLLSIKAKFWHVRSEVLVMAVSGLVGGVKAAV
jgi:hypothetical protein